MRLTETTAVDSVDRLFPGSVVQLATSFSAVSFIGPTHMSVVGLGFITPIPSHARINHVTGRWTVFDDACCKLCDGAK